jgi:E3 ubiquitin-protein ligase RNF144
MHADADADMQLNQDYSAISMRRRRTSEQHNNRMKKCNSDFEMGSFSESVPAANRKRVSRLSGLFHEKGFAFLEEEEQQQQSGSFSGQSLPLPADAARDAGRKVAVMRRMMMQPEEGDGASQFLQDDQEAAGDQTQGDKSSLFSVPHHSHTICSKSLPGSEQQHLSLHHADDGPQLNVTTDERSSTTSADPQSMTCNSLRFCRLCLEELPASDFVRIISCGCSFCHSCLSLYLTIRIQENLNVTSISCPDSGCPSAETTINNLITGNNNDHHQMNRKKNLKLKLMRGLCFLRKSKSFILNEGSSKSSKSHQQQQASVGDRVPNLITENEIEQLLDEKTLHLYKKLLLEAEVESDPCKTFCPAADCDNICLIVRQSSAVMSVSSTISSLSSVSPAAATTVLMSANKLQRSSTRTIVNPAIYCCKCDKRFCVSCRQDYHPGLPCHSASSDESQQLLLLTGGSSDGEDLSTDIKRCPRCSVLIERDAGCAQMMCRKCRHVFCWFCLQSLEDDFLLRHYDRGPCKNKLGHSRASVVWHRTQVVGIFAGFGVLLLLISPLFLMAAPCLLCCNCFTCSSCQQPATDLLTPSSSFSSSTSSTERKDKHLLHH